MARTRTAKPGAKEAEAIANTSVEVKSLPPPDENPVKLFILPKNVSKDARVVTLPDPVTGRSNRYYLCPEKGIYEFTKVSTPNSDPRSWLMTNNEQCQKQNESNGRECGIRSPSRPNRAYLSQNQDLLIATPIDAMFFLIPILAPVSRSKDGKKPMFITFEDHIEAADNYPSSFVSILRRHSLFERRMPAVCDVVDAGDESMYRISYAKLASTLLHKAERMVEKGLPPSIEARFVTRALQAPLMSIKREDSTLTEIVTVESQEPDSQGTLVSSESQSLPPTTSMVSQSITTSTTSVTIKDESISSEAIRRLLRIRTALDFILRSYIPVHLHDCTRTELSISKAIDFTSLNEHLSHLEKLRAEAQALRTISDNISRKRNNEDDDEAAEARAEKKRKKEEEDRRRKNESRAIKDLKKADTTGMKKLSAFFSKGSAKVK